jgi:predicted nucleic acid-binding protein
MATLSKKVFLAPSCLYAFIDRAHEKHAQASAYFRYFSQEEYMLYIDSINLNETYNIIYEKMSPSLAKDFLRIISLSDINIISPEESEIKATFKTIANYNSIDLKLSEAVMAVVASKRNILTICTFDYLHPLFGLNTFFLPI